MSKWEKWELLLIWEAEVRDDAKYTAMNTTSTKNQAGQNINDAEVKKITNPGTGDSYLQS